MSPEDLSWIDAGALLLVLALAVVGALKGAIRFIVGLLTVVAGIVLAGRYGASLNAESWPVIADLDDPEGVGVLLGCGLIFVATLLVGAFLARLLRKAAEETSLGGIDRLLGFVFGALRGALLAMVVVIGLMALDLEPLRQQTASSVTLRVTRRAAEAGDAWIPPKVRSWLDQTIGSAPSDEG